MNVFVDPDQTAATQMERDHLLLLRALDGEACGRVYEWEETWITLGRFQKPSETLLNPQALNWTMRETGGAAVLHGHDLTVGLAVPVQGAIGIREVYRHLVRPLVLAMQDVGQDALLGEDAGFADRREGAYCFVTKSQNDVVSAATGHKLCGCALRVTREAALLQASIPIRQPESPADRWILGSGADHWIEVNAAALSAALVARLQALDSKM